MIPYYIIEEKSCCLYIIIIGNSFEICLLEILVRERRELRQLIFFFMNILKLFMFYLYILE